MPWNDPRQWSWLQFKPPIEAMQEAWRIGVAQASVQQRAKEAQQEQAWRKEIVEQRREEAAAELAYKQSLLDAESRVLDDFQQKVFGGTTTPAIPVGGTREALGGVSTWGIANAPIYTEAPSTDYRQARANAAKWLSHNVNVLGGPAGPAVRAATSVVNLMANEQDQADALAMRFDAQTTHGRRMREARSIVDSLPQRLYVKWLKANGGDPIGMSENGAEFAFQARDLLETEEAIKKRDAAEAAKAEARLNSLYIQYESKKSDLTQAQATLDEMQRRATPEVIKKEGEPKWTHSMEQQQAYVNGLQAEVSRLEGLIQRGNTVTTLTQSGPILPFPASEQDLQVGAIYEHPKVGLVQWNGSRLMPVQTQ